MEGLKEGYHVARRGASVRAFSAEGGGGWHSPETSGATVGAEGGQAGQQPRLWSTGEPCQLGWGGRGTAVTGGGLDTWVAGKGRK